MTDDMTNLRALVEKSAEADLLRETIGFVAERPMEMEVGAATGLRGVKLVVSAAHEGLKAAATKVLSATWQRCRAHFMRNVLAHAGKSGRLVVSAFIATALRLPDCGQCASDYLQANGRNDPPTSPFMVPKVSAFAIAKSSDDRGHTGMRCRQVLLIKRSFSSRNSGVSISDP